jgi:hypothetical protein
VALANCNAILGNLLYETEAAKNARADRKETTGKLIQQGGVIYANQARQRIAKRKADEVEMAEKRLAKAKKAEKKPWLDLMKDITRAAKARTARLNKEKKLQAVISYYHSLYESSRDEGGGLRVWYGPVARII